MVEQQVTGLILELCRELDKNQIAYCHWKSNAALDLSLSGVNDLDLLVSRADAQRFTEILVRLGFKLVHGSQRAYLPGVLDYFGFDYSTERLIHVHAHYQLVIGHDATKNYHLPIEAAYLASASQPGLLKIPAPEFELIVLVIRLMLKHSTWDTILLAQGGLSRSERNELDYLSLRSNQDKVKNILLEHLPYFPPGLFSLCFHALTTRSSSCERIRLGNLVTRSLRPCARRSSCTDSLIKIWRRFQGPLEKRLLHIDSRKQMSSGGLFVALVGGDGAGKTTTVDAVYQWLVHDFRVRHFHMGKPDWSFLTRLIRGILKIGQILGFYKFIPTEQVPLTDSSPAEFPGYPWVIRETCTARDRLLTYQRGRSFASNGGLVIMDRFSIPDIKLMDHARVRRAAGNHSQTFLLRNLISLEESYYRRISLPDVLIVLRAEPEIAVQRKREEDQSAVRRRSSEIWDMDWGELPVHVIDATSSKELVIKEAKRLIWSHL